MLNGAVLRTRAIFKVYVAGLYLPEKKAAAADARFEDLFAELVLPLRERRSLRLEADHTAETATAYLRHVYEFEDIDVIMLEGIFLLKREFARCYDLSIWLECGFDTALERAIARGQEGLPPEETARAYRTVYFPAQVIHFRRDEPKAAASLLVNNDPRLGPVDWMS